MPDELEGEIEANLMEDIIKTIPRLTAIHSTDHSILIHGMGDQTRNFYRHLRQNKNIELLWTGWGSNIWWTYLLSFIPGQAGLVKVLDRQQLDTLYLQIGQQSTCGLYYVPNAMIDDILHEIKNGKPNERPERLFEKENNFFMLKVYFDYQFRDKDTETFRRWLLMGDNLDTEIKNTLTRTK